MDITDSYSDNRTSGKTIGTKSPSGILRKGIDAEKIVAVDNGALRFKPLITSGWGRQGIAYGPYTRSNGLALAVFMLNGHNTSQLETIEWFKQRIKRWVIGSETESPLKRLRGWLRSRQKKGTARRLLWWMRISPLATKLFPIPSLNENLAVGWFASETPSNPLTEGNGFIVHATGGENGELWARVGTNCLSAFRGLQNIQVYYVVILREKGAAYYAASVPNARGLVAYPYLRPLAIDPFNKEATLFAGIHQCVLGQIGFRADTRVYGVQIESIPELATWYGTAHAADKLIGDGNLDGTEAEIGGYWQVSAGNYRLTPQGLLPDGSDNLALLDPGKPSGLIHVLIETVDCATECSLVWRFQDEQNHWRLVLKSDRCQLQVKENGNLSEVADSNEWYLETKVVTSVQILDDGKIFGIYLNGKLVFGQRFSDPRFKDATGVGLGSLESDDRNLYFRFFEAHPRSVPLPDALDLGSPWLVEGKELVVQDNFAGLPQDLAGKTTSIGNKVWHRDIGKGIIEISGNNTAKVKADARHPNPDRTAYTIPWDYPNLADVEVEIIPPGTKRGKGDKGRGGIICYQDEDNYIIINTWLDDSYEGESISSFFRIDGFEEIYDAVWANIGQTIAFGQPYTLRVVFDGMNYGVWVNNQPVLYRALTDIYPDLSPLQINRVGIVANWEWGNDTGSAFRNFTAKA
ncbi:nucleotide-binding protein [Pleurocapsales cyanobacterium LEGE 06147]|nr:nucleotide-binding protein [Pleurocapsales cyanobacterium LEGE 06147]